MTNNQESRDIATFLQYEPAYRHMIPHRVAWLGRIALPPLHICDLAQKAKHSSSNYRSLSQYINEWVVEVARELEEKEQASSNSSSSLQFSRSELAIAITKVEGEEEVK